MIPGTPKKSGWVTKRDRAGAAWPEGMPMRMTTRRPCSTPSMPSVITSGGIRSSVMPRPFRRPKKAPAARQATIAGTIPPSAPFMTLPAMIADSETTPPTERSMPSRPPRITTFCPAATMPSSEATIRSLRICAPLAKPGESSSPR
ncbi:hypothetical protein CO676_15995 [Sinorhizobium sp. BJ1]|nr:hypothetical protein CO676_15995 [Sinorhizobium sp. BJ1]